MYLLFSNCTEEFMQKKREMACDIKSKQIASICGINYIISKLLKRYLEEY